tara:strand:- start:891 stop:1199 length:309 start_codon:yes stop_codon:yes gene_type:complete
MDSYTQAMESKKKRIKNINKKNPLHGWLVLDESYREYIKNKIYSSFKDNSYKEISCTTVEYINPYPQDLNVKYVGLVDQYIGEMVQKPNIINNLLQQIYDIY